METMEGRHDAYVRGIEAGQVQARLGGHDSHFLEHDAQLDKLLNLSTQLTLGQQSLAEAAIAEKATTVATAKALREAKETADAAASESWSPVTRIAVASAAIMGLFNLYQAIKPT